MSLNSLNSAFLLCCESERHIHLICFRSPLSSYTSFQAVFKEARETLLRMGTMRFVESLVTERPNLPARPLHFSNEKHSLAFRFGVGDDPSASVGGKTSSIVPLPTLQFDSRAEDGLLSFFQSTPAGTHNLLSTLPQLSLTTLCLQATSLVKFRFNCCF
jgi:hypothetical protein